MVQHAAFVEILPQITDALLSYKVIVTLHYKVITTILTSNKHNK